MSNHPPLAIYSLDLGPMNAPQFCAFFASGSELLPVRIVANTEADVRRKAAEFWEKHGAKHEASDAPAELPEWRRLALAKAHATRAANRAARVQ
jgi:hypothetical protein